LTFEEFRDARTCGPLKTRGRLSNGSRACVDPVYSSNGKLTPLYAVVNGTPEHHPEGIYNLRYVKAGKRLWDAVGADPQLALTAKLRVEHKLQAVSLGLTEPDPVKTSGKTSLADAVKQYLRDISKAKSKRTLYAYTRTLKPMLRIRTRRKPPGSMPWR